MYVEIEILGLGWAHYKIYVEYRKYMRITYTLVRSFVRLFVRSFTHSQINLVGPRDYVGVLGLVSRAWCFLIQNRVFMYAFQLVKNENILFAASFSLDLSLMSVLVAFGLYKI